MWTILSILWTFLSGPIGRWVLISVASVAFMAWIRHDARAPWANQVTELRAAIVKRDKDAARDRALAEQQAAKAEELEHALDKIIATAGTTAGACRLSAGELDSLRKLARAN